ncbi:MAG TPA: hypothetical protein VNN08_22930 [Thermoanaerobaculia bacterium]|nr:hypothetical protein [Thermoanaerobaculia bacterium]
MSLGELREAAIIATIIDRVGMANRFCGETLLQKSAFFLKDLFGIPLAPVPLCHYGPFSFDLRDQWKRMTSFPSGRTNSTLLTAIIYLTDRERAPIL